MTGTKKSLLASGAALLASVALLAGTTFAWFTDSVTNTGNTIQAGTLDIALNGGDETTLFSSGEGTGFWWEPGRSQKATANITNEGTLWLKYTMRFENVVTTGGANITEALDVYVVAADAADLTNAKYLGTMKELMMQGSFAAKNSVLAPNGYTGADGQSSESFTVVVKMKEEANNDYQGCGVTFDIVIHATQYNYEKDGFGNPDYDKEAPLPEVINSSNYNTLQDAISAAKKGDTVVVSKSQTLTTPLTISEDITLDLGENTLSSSTLAAPIQIRQDNANVTIKAAGDGGISSSGSNHNCLNITADNANIVIDGGTYSSEDYMFIKDGNGSTQNTHLTIKNITYIGDRGVHFTGKDGVVDVIDSTFTTTGYSALYIGGNTVCNLENVTVNGNVFAADTNGSADNGYSTINIKSGHYTKLSNSDSCTISVTGGTFSQNPTAYVDTENYTVTKTGSVWTVTAK